jgi:hypothetical protein
MYPKYPYGQIHGLTGVLVIFYNFHKGEIPETPTSVMQECKNTVILYGTFKFSWQCEIILWSSG